MPPRPPPRYIRAQDRIIYEEPADDDLGYNMPDRRQAADLARPPVPHAQEVSFLRTPEDAWVPSMQELRQGRRVAPSSEAEGATGCFDPELCRNVSMAYERLAAHMATKEAKAFSDALRLSNPYDKLGSYCFMNRSAVVFANLDALYSLTTPHELDEDDGEVKALDDTLLHYADLCGGPGGFVEYAFWRRGFERMRGYGITLRKDGAPDYDLPRFGAHARPATFQPSYGADGTGELTSAENVDRFYSEVAAQTPGQMGVHLASADGEEAGPPSGSLPKRLAVCEVLLGLQLVRPGGRFVMKFFDMSSRFAVGLVYLLYVSYQAISIVKPFSSPPWSPDVFVVCTGRRGNRDPVIRYLMEVRARPVVRGPRTARPGAHTPAALRSAPGVRSTTSCRGCKTSATSASSSTARAVWRAIMRTWMWSSSCSGPRSKRTRPSSTTCGHSMWRLRACSTGHSPSSTTSSTAAHHPTSAQTAWWRGAPLHGTSRPATPLTMANSHRLRTERRRRPLRSPGRRSPRDPQGHGRTAFAPTPRGIWTWTARA